MLTFTLIISAISSCRFHSAFVRFFVSSPSPSISIKQTNTAERECCRRFTFFRLCCCCLFQFYSLKCWKIAGAVRDVYGRFRTDYTAFSIRHVFLVLLFEMKSQRRRWKSTDNNSDNNSSSMISPNVF